MQPFALDVSARSLLALAEMQTVRTTHDTTGVALLVFAILALAAIGISLVQYMRHRENDTNRNW